MTRLEGTGVMAELSMIGESDGSSHDENDGAGSGSTSDGAIWVISMRTGIMSMGSRS